MSPAPKKQSTGWVLPAIVSILGTALIGMAGIGIAKVERLIDRVESVSVQYAKIETQLEYMERTLDELKGRD